MHFRVFSQDQHIFCGMSDITADAGSKPISSEIFFTNNKSMIASFSFDWTGYVPFFLL